MLVKCDCVSEFQDRTYGKNNRVANEVTGKASSEKKGRCSVCGKEHTEKK